MVNNNKHEGSIYCCRDWIIPIAATFRRNRKWTKLFVFIISSPSPSILPLVSLFLLSKTSPSSSLQSVIRTNNSSSLSAIGIIYWTRLQNCTTRHTCRQAESARQTGSGTCSTRRRRSTRRQVSSRRGILGCAWGCTTVALAGVEQELFAKTCEWEIGLL